MSDTDGMKMDQATESIRTAAKECEYRIIDYLEATYTDQELEDFGFHTGALHQADEDALSLHDVYEIETVSQLAIA